MRLVQGGGSGGAWQVAIMRLVQGGGSGGARDVAIMRLVQGNGGGGAWEGAGGAQGDVRAPHDAATPCR